MNFKQLAVLFLFSISFLGTTSESWACPGKHGIPDWNCDGKVVVSVFGDSLAFGFGDTVNGNKGGYVLRAQKKLSDVTFHNLGVQGLRTKEFLALLKGIFDQDKKPEQLSALLESDIVILDLGRNDRWLFGKPIDTYRNLKKGVTKIKDEIKQVTGASPIVVMAVIMLPNRGSQGPWVKELDAIILGKTTKEDPSDLRFDLVSKRLLSTDQIHPTSKGYTALAQTFIKYLTDKLSPLMKKLRPDTDKDGLSDFYETLQFGTDPALIDTDGDTKSDGDEVLTFLTDPLVAD